VREVARLDRCCRYRVRNRHTDDTAEVTARHPPHRQHLYVGLKGVHRRRELCRAPRTRGCEQRHRAACQTPQRDPQRTSAGIVEVRLVVDCNDQGGLVRWGREVLQGQVASFRGRQVRRQQHVQTHAARWDIHSGPQVDEALKRVVTVILGRTADQHPRARGPR
jgi:hypothetical protein